MRTPFFCFMETFTPPQSAKANARRVLSWREKYGDRVRGMTAVGWARARQLAAGGPVSLDVVKRMAQFARHRKNAAVAPEYRDEPWRDAGHVAWLGWGGSTGIAWAQSISSRQKEAGTAVTHAFGHGPSGLFSAPGMNGRADSAAMGTNGRMCKACGKRKAERSGMCLKCGGMLLQARAKVGRNVYKICPFCQERPIDDNVKLATGKWLPACKGCANGIRSAQKRVATEKAKFSKASTQFNMPAPIRAQALLFASRIDKADLAEDGIETDTHVTIKYGIRPDMMPVVTRIAQETPPMVLRFGDVTLFTENDEFDVVKVEVESNELRSLNGRLAALPGSDNTRPFYNPHLTIAYVRKGAGGKYTGAGPLSGQSVTVSELTFSDANGVKTAVPLQGSPWITRAKATDSFSVYKDAAGDYRWVAISSNSYRDRDQEIVSQAALEADCEYADSTKEYGPLRFWHAPGWDLGECDFNMMHGRMLIESGGFKTPAIGAAVARRQKEYQLSIGFNHPRNEPADGIYYHIRRFERSLVPSGRAANPFTSLSVTKENDMSTAEKQAQLRELLGDPQLVASVLGNASAAQKQADNLGIAFKEVDLTKLAQNPSELLEFAIKNFEAAQQKADKKEDMEPEEEEKPADTAVKGMDMYMKKMDDYMAKMDGYMGKMAGGEAKKEADPVVVDAQAATKAAEVLNSSRIASLETAVKELTGKLQDALGELATARKEASDPVVVRGLVNGTRPTQDSATVKEGAVAKVEEPKPNAAVPDQQVVKSFDQNWDGFLNFVTAPPQ